MTHTPEAAERPLRELLESGKFPPAPETGPRSSSEELWDQDPKAPEPETER